MRREKTPAIGAILLLTALTALTAMSATAGPASAAIIEHTFSGVLDNVDGPPPSPWQDAALKSSFSVRYQVDTETPDLSDSDFIGRYAVLGIWVSIDGIELQPENDTVIEVFDNPLGRDDYLVSFSDLPGGINGGIGLTGLNPIQSDDLPLEIDLNDWNFVANFGIAYATGVNEFGRAGGNISQFTSRIVPAPAAMWLLLTTCMWRSRRRLNRTGSAA